MSEFIDREKAIANIKAAYCCGCENYNGVRCRACQIMDAMDDARAVIQDGLTRYVKKKTKARSMAKAEADPFAELEGWESMEQIQDAYGYGEITADRRDKLTDLWEAREAAKNSRKGSDKYTDLVTEMLETAIRRVGNEYADMLFEYDRQRREAEKQCEQLAMEGMMKK